MANDIVKITSVVLLSGDEVMYEQSLDCPLFMEPGDTAEFNLKVELGKPPFINRKLNAVVRGGE